MENVICYVVIMRNQFGIKAFTDTYQTPYIPSHIRNAEVFPLVDNRQGKLDAEKVKDKVERLIEWSVEDLTPKGFKGTKQITAKLDVHILIDENINESLFSAMVGKAADSKNPIINLSPEEAVNALDKHTRERMVRETVDAVKLLFGL